MQSAMIPTRVLATAAQVVPPSSTSIAATLAARVQLEVAKLPATEAEKAAMAAAAKAGRLMSICPYVMHHHHQPFFAIRDSVQQCSSHMRLLLCNDTPPLSWGRGWKNVNYTCCVLSVRSLYGGQW